MEKLNKQMDDALNTKVAALNATDDETGDGKVDALDLKHQLDRVEAQLELQDQQNRALLRSQKRLLWVLLCISRHWRSSTLRGRSFLAWFTIFCLLWCYRSTMY